MVLLGAAFAARADDAKFTDDPLWKSAMKAYEHEDREAGHQFLKALIQKNPGDVDLTLACLNKIGWSVERWEASNPWTVYVTERIWALERMGAISANTRGFRDAVRAGIDKRLRDGRLFEIAEELDRLVKANPPTRAAPASQELIPNWLAH